MKLKKEVKIGFVVIVLLCLAYMFLKPDEKLKLNGKSVVTISLNDDYHDDGVNIKDAHVEGNVNTKKVGTYTLIYSYKDQKLKREVNVVDPDALIMNLNGSADTYVKQGEQYIESGCHVIDKNEGNLTSMVQIKGEVDTSQIGEYEVEYSVTNQQGVHKVIERKVHVVGKDVFKENQKGIPVLMYHYIYTDEKKPEKINVNYLKDTVFEQQLQYLIDENYYFPSYQELRAYIDGLISLPEKSVVLTFDDGEKGFLKYGIPLLKKYKIPATSFLIGTKEAQTKLKTYASEYISFQSHSYDMHKAGGHIGHGGIISAMSKNEIVNDLNKNIEIVQNSEAFAYPYGDVTPIAIDALKDTDILCAFTTKYGRVKKGDDYTQLPRVRVSGNQSLQSFIKSIE